MADPREIRLSGLRQAMSDAGADAFLVTNLQNVSYLTGFTGSSGFVLVTSRKTYFMTDSRYETQSAEEVKGFEVVIHRARWTDEMARIAADAGVKKLGFESRGVSFETHGALVKAMA